MNFILAKLVSGDDALPIIKVASSEQYQTTWGAPLLAYPWLVSAMTWSEPINVWVATQTLGIENFTEYVTIGCVLSRRLIQGEEGMFLKCNK